MPTPTSIDNPLDALPGILSSSDPLDRIRFDPVDYLNELFPNDLTGLEDAMHDFDERIVQMEEETREYTRAHRGKDGELKDTQDAIQQLFQRIGHIKEKAGRAEQMVQDITSEIKALDYAKRHLTISITTIKRLQMLVTAVEQLKIMSQQKHYKEVSRLLQAVFELSEYFTSFRNISSIGTLLSSLNEIQEELRTQTFEDFEKGFSKDGTLVEGKKNLLQSACLVVDVLGDEARNKIMDWYSQLQLQDYQAIFRPNEEVSELDNVSRRYAWLRRMLKACDEDHSDIFPASWKIQERVCEKFCDITSGNLSEQLSRSSTMDVKVLLRALQLTIEFENQLARRFTRMDVSQVMTETQEEFEHGFTKRISACFDPYLGIFVDVEDKTLAEMITSYKINPISEEDASMSVLSSSTDLFYFYRETIQRCAKLSNRKPFYDLSLTLSKWLRVYANDVLIGKLTRDERRTPTPEELRVICLVLNTADYCFNTTSQLEEKLKQKISDEYKEQIDLEKEREVFLEAASSCIRALVRGIEQCYEPALSAMARIPWAQLELVGDQSDYVSIFQSTLSSCAVVVRRTISNNRYFRNFCDKFVESFVNKYLGNMMKCRPISEVGAEQMLLDAHALKTTLLEMTSMGADNPAPPPSTFVKHVERSMRKIDTLLKVVLTPPDPPEGIVENYIYLIGDKNSGNFQKILELKGLKKSEQSSLIDTFQQRTSGLNISDCSPLMASIQITPASSLAPSSLAFAATNAFTLGTASELGDRSTSPPPGSSAGSSNKAARFNDLRKFVLAGMNIRKQENSVNLGLGKHNRQLSLTSLSNSFASLGEKKD
ncbi:uncharacterized protein VTP21DRAFT_5637 [Calcarisporiella thermophila]|uniref:uncharacterized protein n=1 Tax=Calcarisporiella thermophila TaxID=911321 RepID=UPI003741EA29